MATLESRNGWYRLIFKYQGQRFAHSLRTQDERIAEAIRGGVDKTILQLQQRLLVVPEGADLKEFILSGGQILQPVAPLIVPTGVLVEIDEQDVRQADLSIDQFQQKYISALEVADTDFPRTEVSVLEENIGFQLYEEKVRQERLPTKHEIEWELRFSPDRKFYETVPSGKLVLQITDGSGLRRCWTDRSDRRVEQFLNSFVLGVFRAAESLKQARDEAETRWREGQEREARRQEEEQRRQKEREEQDRIRREEERRLREGEARMQKLDSEVTGWVKARQIRAYVAAVRSAHESAGVASGSDLVNWLKWADGRADELDPLTRLFVSNSSGDCG